MARHKAIRVAVFAAAGILLLLLCGIAILHTPPVRRYAIRQAATLLSEQGITFDAAGLDYNLLNLTLDLRDVTVQSKATPDLPPLAKIEEARVDLGLRDLLRGKLRVEEAVVRRPELYLVIDEKGRDNVPRPPERKTQEKTEWLVETLRVTGGSFRLDDRRQKINLVLPLWRLQVDGNPDGPVHNIQLATEQAGQVLFQQRQLPIGALNTSIILEENAADVRSFEVLLGESRLAFSGKLDNFDDPRFDFRADTSIELGSVVEFAGMPQRVQGELRLSLAATGPLGDLKVTADASSDNLQLEQIDDIRLKARANYQRAQERVDVDSLSVTAPEGRLNGAGSIALTEKAGESNFRAQITGLALEPVLRSLKSPTVIASRATGNVSARWPGLEYERATGSGSFRLVATREAPVRDVIPVSGRVNVRGGMNNVTSELAGISALGASANGEVRLSERRLSGRVELSTADVGATLAAAEGFAGRDLTDVQVSGPASIQAQLAGTLQSPRVDATVQAAGLNVGQIKGANLDAVLTYTPKGVDLKTATVQWQGQTIRTSGSIGLGGRTQPLKFETRIENATIETILAGIGRSDIPVSGGIAADAVIGGTTDNPQITANLTGTGIVAYNERFGDLTAQVRVDGDLVQIDRLRLDQPGAGYLEASGTYHVEQKVFSGTATADNIALRTFTLPDGTPVRGAFQLNATGSGTADNPQLTAQLTAKGLQVREYEIGALTASVKSAGQQAELEAAIPKYNLTARATTGIREPYPVQFEARMDKLELGALPIQWKEPVTGTVTGVVTGSGTVRDWKQGEASARLDALDLRFRNEPIRSEGPLLASYKNGTLTIDQATITAANSRLTVAGSLPLERTAPPGAITLAGKIDLERAVALAPVEPPIIASGEATLNATLKGTLQQMDPTAELVVRDASFDAANLRLPFNEVQLSAGIDSGVVTLNSASAVWGPANISASGVVPLGLLGEKLPDFLPKGSGPAKFQAQVNELAIAALPNVPEQVSGDVSVRIEGSAPSPDLNALDATITFPQLLVRVEKLVLQQTAPSVIRVTNGTARVEQFEITGPNTKLQVAGAAQLAEPRNVDLRVTGGTDAGILSVFVEDLRAAGAIRLEVAATGPLPNPQMNGFVEFSQGQLRLETPRVDADELNLRIDIAGKRASVTRIGGFLNGGTIDGSGSVTWGGEGIGDVNLDLSARGVFLDFPENLRTLSNADITVRTQGSRIVVGGQVNVVEGAFTEDVNLDTGIMAYLERQPELGFTEERNEFLERVSLNVGIDSGAPLIIDNNLAKAELTLDLRAVGTYYNPSVVGRVTIEEGGEFYLQERTYLVDRGTITFTSERRIEPSLDILARTRAADYDITVQIQGEPGKKTETILTSDPPLPEPDILAVLLTGRTLEEIRGREVDVARDQVLSYLTGRVGGVIGQELQQATGLSMVRVEPDLIANEEDPTARLTVGQNITSDLDLIYSMDLRNSNDQIFIVEYDLTRRFLTRAIRQSDNSVRVEFRHDVTFGGIPEPPRNLAQRERRRVGDVQFTGTRYFTAEQLAKRFKVKEGKTYDFFKVRKGLDRIQEGYREADLLESRVRLDRNVSGSTVDLTVNVIPGPKVQFVFEGMAVSGGLRERVQRIWHEGVFDTQRAEDAIAAIREELVKDDFLRPKIEYRITEGDPKRVVFDIQRGEQYHDVKLVFDGANQVNPGNLEDLIDEQKLEAKVYTDPDDVTDVLTRYYQEEGFLMVKVDDPRYELDTSTRTGRVVFPIAEGPRFKVAEIRLAGNTVLDEAALRKEMPLQTGEPYTPELRQKSAALIQDRYAALAYNDALIEHSVKQNGEGLLDVVFNIEEGRQMVVKDIVITGNNETSDRLVRTQLEIKPGDLLVLDNVSKSRRNLYNSGAYSLVDVEREIIEDQSGLAPNQAAVRLKVNLREIRPFALRYGGYFNTDQGPGGIVDFSNRNSLGSARVIGIRARYDANFREGRLYFSQPNLLRFPVRTLSSAFYSREFQEAFIADRKGLTIQQDAWFHERYLFNYGYRLENVKVTEREPDPILGPLPPVQYRIAPLTGAVTREARDDFLDASRGSFTSHALEFAPQLLGSDIRYIRYFGQFFKYFPLTEPVEIPFRSGLRKTRLVYATGVRYGAARALGGQVLISSERFFAGGGNTVRGFANNELGPKDSRGDPLGGSSMFVLNNELRLPLFSMFDGVGFVDIGNVFDKVTDFRLGDLRRTAGVGLRARTPWFLLRLDYGFKLDKQPGESSGRLFFSIGQAF